MRSRLALPVLLALALLAWFFWPRERMLPPPAPRVERLPELQSAPEPTPELAAQDTGSSRVLPADAPRFEPLPAEPTELVLRFVTGNPETTLRGVEAWALAMDEYQGYQGRIADVERELREHGTRLECDAQGRAHLPLPERWWFVGARKGALFGAQCFEADDAPEDMLELVESHECVVHARSATDRPLAGVPITLSDAHGVIWQGSSDALGALVIPNLGWLLDDFGHADSTFVVAALEAAADPASYTFDASLPLPRAIELRLESASALRFRLLASDGTPAPVGGEVGFGVSGAEAAQSRAHSGEHAQGMLALRAGVAELPFARGGTWLDAYAVLDGGQYAAASLRVPEEPGPHEIPLRLELSQQVLVFRALGPSGETLADRTLEWFTFDQSGVNDRDPGVELEPLKLDGKGRGALVVSRPDLVPRDPQAEDDEEENPPVRARGILRLCEGARVLESEPIRIETLSAAPLLDLGVVRLEPARTLVRGRVHDEVGRGLARVAVGIELLYEDDGEVRSDESPRTLPLFSDADGRFELRGLCPSTRARLVAERTGYCLPEGARMPEFAGDSGASVDVTLVRTGVLRVSLVTDAPLRESYRWEFEGPGGEQHLQIYPGEVTGELVFEQWWMTPGTYHVRLVTDDPLTEPLVDVPDVAVRSGETTLDPRLLRVRLHGPAAVRAPVDGPMPQPVELRIVDEHRRSLRDGTCTTWGFDHCSIDEFHAGVLTFRGDEIGRWAGLWAPGRRYREIEVPEHGAEIELQPALPLRVQLDVPATFSRAGVHLMASLEGEDCGLDHIPKVLAGIEVDARGEVLFPCPGPCTFHLELHALLTDASGLLRSSQDLQTSVPLEFVLADQPGEQLWKPAIRAEEWAALAQVLGVGR
ncbi:MAG: carboxypeptidase regulatory-like domain-containing protein [Planctomycetes bacterium]|nr:carboxypeptidase regulatory-like domain-containing protein [Planctomycetota bacterium]